MKSSKKAALLAAIYTVSLLLVMGGFLYISESERRSARRTVAVGYDHAFAELTAAVGELDTSLKKALCASSPSMVSAVAAESYARAACASQAISSLPYGNIELEHTAAFLAKTGDYMYYLSRAAARGETLSDEEREAMRTLSESAAQVSAALSELSARLLAGEISAAELEKAEDVISQAEDSIVGTGFAAGFKAMETDFPEFPSLIYDGPFSEHIEKAVPLTLEGTDEISESAAIQIAAKLLGTDPSHVDLACTRESDIPVYVLTLSKGTEMETVEVSCQGGRILYYGTTREPSYGSIAPEDAVKTASRFLETQGYQNMRVTYWASEGGEVVVNFAYDEDGVICYPDLVKVTIATDTGAVSALETAGYTMCHTARSLPEVAISEEEAASALSPLLTIKSHNLAVIPTSGKNEVFCHEFLCEDENGHHSLVYVNCLTGREEKILLLLESENGTLTI